MTGYRKELSYRNSGPVAQNRAVFSLKSKHTSGSLIREIILSLKTAGDSAAVLHPLEHSYKDLLNPTGCTPDTVPAENIEKSKCVYISWHGKYASYSSELD